MQRKYFVNVRVEKPVISMDNKRVTRERLAHVFKVSLKVAGPFISTRLVKSVASVMNSHL